MEVDGQRMALAGISDELKHAERRVGEAVLEFLGRNNLDTSTVKRICTELSPCRSRRRDCDSSIRNTFPNAKITYSYSHPAQVPEWQRAIADAAAGRLPY